MCNVYEQHVKWVEYVRMMQAIELGMVAQQFEPDPPEADYIRINDMAPVIRATAYDNEVDSRR